MGAPCQPKLLAREVLTPTPVMTSPPYLFQKAVPPVMWDRPQWVCVGLSSFPGLVICEQLHICEQTAYFCLYNTLASFISPGQLVVRPRFRLSLSTPSHGCCYASCHLASVIGRSQVTQPYSQRPLLYSRRSSWICRHFNKYESW